MEYVVIWKTATHVAFKLYEEIDAAQSDAHMSRQWCGRLYEIADADGFAASEAKDLYTHGVEAMAPGWGLREIEEV